MLPRTVRLANIYVSRGLDKSLADQVASELMADDAVGAHARDELGFSPSTAARPIQAMGVTAGAGAIFGVVA